MAHGLNAGRNWDKYYRDRMPKPEEGPPHAPCWGCTPLSTCPFEAPCADRTQEN